MITLAILFMSLALVYSQEEAIKPIVPIGFSTCGKIKVQTISSCLENGKMVKIQPFTIPVADCNAPPKCPKKLCYMSIFDKPAIPVKPILVPRCVPQNFPFTAISETGNSKVLCSIPLFCRCSCKQMTMEPLPIDELSLP